MENWIPTIGTRFEVNVGGRPRRLTPRRCPSRRGACVETQADLAAALGVSRQTVISIENGRYLPSLPLAFRIATLFEVPIEQLFDSERPVNEAILHDFVRPRCSRLAPWSCWPSEA